ncbi:MAG: TIGR01777 family protein [Phycisphaerae bacterium]|nr:TIGR01777 family protein [Phycisphaerae bacterium]
MRVLITGASGLIGSALTNRLTKEGHDVFSLVRPGSTRTGIAWQPGADLEDHPDLDDLDAVVHLAGAGIADQRWTPARKEVLWRSRVESTAHLRGALEERANPPKRFLCASAIGWYGHRDHDILDESSAPGHGFLADLCAAWESAAQSTKMTSACLRFGLVLDRSGGALGKMLPPFQLGLGGPLGDGRHWQSWIGLDDAVRHIMHLCVAPSDQVRGVHNVVAPEPIQQRDFASALAKALGRPAWVRTPRWAVQLLFGDMAKEALLASTRVVPKRRLQAGPSFQTPNLQDALGEALRRRSN